MNLIEAFWDSPAADDVLLAETARRLEADVAADQGVTAVLTDEALITDHELLEKLRAAGPHAEIAEKIIRRFGERVAAKDQLEARNAK